MKRLGPLSLHILLAVVMVCSALAVAHAQGMDHHSEPAIRSTQLKITGLDGKAITLTPEELAALPHKTVSVFNAHSKVTERYSGVALIDLLARVGVPNGEQVKGKLLLTGILAKGTDNYQVLYSLAEVDPSIHNGEVIVADSVDDHNLGKDGAFKMVSTEEKRPARWVRNLSSITVIEAKP